MESGHLDEPTRRSVAPKWLVSANPHKRPHRPLASRREDHAIVSEALTAFLKVDLSGCSIGRIPRCRPSPGEPQRHVSAAKSIALGQGPGTLARGESVSRGSPTEQLSRRAVDPLSRLSAPQRIAAWAVFKRELGGPSFQFQLTIGEMPWRNARSRPVKSTKTDRRLEPRGRLLALILTPRPRRSLRHGIAD